MFSIPYLDWKDRKWQRKAWERNQSSTSLCGIELGFDKNNLAFYTVVFFHPRHICCITKWVGFGKVCTLFQGITCFVTESKVNLRVFLSTASVGAHFVVCCSQVCPERKVAKISETTEVCETAQCTSPLSVSLWAVQLCSVFVCVHPSMLCSNLSSCVCLLSHPWGVEEEEGGVDWVQWLHHRSISLDDSSSLTLSSIKAIPADVWETRANEGLWDSMRCVPPNLPTHLKCKEGVKMLPGAIWLHADNKDSHVWACFGIYLIKNHFK